MDAKYREAIAEASTMLMGAMLEDGDELIAVGRQLDEKVRKMVFQLGLFLVRNLFYPCHEDMGGSEKRRSGEAEDNGRAEMADHRGWLTTRAIGTSR